MCTRVQPLASTSVTLTYTSFSVNFAMDRDGSLRRFHELSRTTRYRIRKAMATRQVEESSSSEDEIPEIPRPQSRAQQQERLGAYLFIFEI